MLPVGSHDMSNFSQSYASRAQIRKAIAAVECGGIQIGGVTLHPNGVIELFSKLQVTPKPANDFDRLDEAGVL